MISHLKEPFNFTDTKHLVTIFVSLFIFMAIPVTVFVLLNSRPLTPKAAAVRGVSGDFWADTIIGRRDFSDVLAGGYVNPKWLQRPGGAVIDRETSGSTLGYLYAQSTRENRIIALNLDNCIPNNSTCSAEKVIGQPFTSDYSACNGDSSFQNYPTRVPASASTLCFVKESSLSTAENLAFIGMHSQGGNLYVPDTENHRILIYKNAWTDQVADEVIGQADFSGVYCNKTNVAYTSTVPSSSSLCLVDSSDTANSQSGVTLDSTGNLWVADTGNHRVLRFPKQADGTISKSANLVLGQTNFTTGPNSFGSGLNKFNNPNSLKFDPSGNLYVSDGVADGGNARILKFTPNQQVIGGTGSVFATNTAFISEVDTINNGLWVMSSPNLRLYGFDGSLKKEINIGNQFIMGNIGVAKNGGVAIASPTQGFVWISSPMTKASGWDRELFDPRSAINNSRLTLAYGVAVTGNKLFASDICRILFWNNPGSLTNGKSADGVLIQPSFTNTDCNINHVATLKGDSDNRLWAKTQQGVYVYDANNLSSTGSGPFKIISGSIPVLSGGSIDIFRDDHEGLQGIAPQKIGSTQFLWVSDRNTNRVVRIRDPLGSPVIDVVLGQTSSTGTACNRGQVGAANEDPTTSPNLSMLCKPGAVSIDKFGNVYVSDHALEVEGNWRLLLFLASTLPANNTSVIYAPNATKEFPKSGGQTHATWEPAFDSQNHMVVGYNAYVGGRFPGYYLNPVDVNSKQPSGYVKDYYSMTFGTTFDSQDNLYISDINRARIMIYKNPFGNSVSSPPVSSGEPTPTPTPTTAPTVSITSPANGSLLRGTTTITASASSPTTISKVEFLVNGTVKGSDTSSPYSYSWSTTSATNGSNQLTAKVYDANAQTATSSSITVTVDNQAPIVNLTYPLTANTVSGSPTLKATASDNIAIAKVDFFVDATLVGSSTTSPYQFVWNSTSTYNGTHQVYARAIDTAGNIGTSSTNIIGVQNSGDTQKPSAPVLSGTVSAPKINLSWTASTDNVAVTGYYVYRGSILISQTGGSTTNYSDTPNCGTTVSYSVRSLDGAGNISDPSNTLSQSVPCVTSDTTAPTVPSNLTASAVSSSQINLSWSASSDNVAVAGYAVYRGTTRIATVTTTSFGNTGLSANTAYSYSVKAFDGVGNYSAASNTASATTQPIVSTTNTLGSIAGYVSSSVGGAISGARIRTYVSGVRVTTSTNSTGFYSLVNLPEGTYSVRYSKPESSKYSYSSQTQTVLVIGGFTTTHNVVLRARRDD